MKPVKKTFIIVTLSFLLTILSGGLPAFGVSNDVIFTWVAEQLKVKADLYPMPEINFVSHPELQTILRKNSLKTFKRWAIVYGEKKAEEIMENYLKEVIGLFVPETRKLYVGRFLESARRDSIVAHEFAHYFQFMKDGPLHPQGQNADLKHLYYEMQASLIENEFIKTFYGDPVPVEQIISSINDISELSE